MRLERIADPKGNAIILILKELLKSAKMFVYLLTISKYLGRILST